MSSLQAIAEMINKACRREQCGFRPNKNDESIVCFGCTHYPRKPMDFSLLVSEEQTMQTEKLLFKGSSKFPRYTGDNVDVRAGEVAFVSKQKKHQLLNDFPGLWVEVEEKKAEEPQEEVIEPVEEPEPETPEEEVVKPLKAKKGKR